MELLQQQLLRAQARMCKQADKHRVERVFQVGDSVYLKLQPYVQTSIARRSTQKLAFKFFGPYTILKRVGAVAYKLDLPAGSQIHDVVHVSQLKRHLPPQTEVSDANLILQGDENQVVQPLQILASRSIQRGGVTIPQVHVAWDADTPPSATWEDAFALQQRFPDALAWGQASSQGVGHVTAQPKPGSKQLKRRLRKRAAQAQLCNVQRKAMERRDDKKAGHASPEAGTEMTVVKQKLVFFLPSPIATPKLVLSVLPVWIDKRGRNKWYPEPLFDPGFRLD